MARKRQSNFSIALDELINGKDTSAEAPKVETAAPKAEPVAAPKPEPTPAPKPEPKPAPKSAPKPEPKPAPAPAPVVKEKPKKTLEEEMAAMETLINAGTIINGSIVSKNALRILGTVEGDVSTTSAMDVSGDITGKVVAKELNLTSGTVEGNVNCVEHMTMDSDSMILGDIAAKELVLDGKVKGNVNVGGAVIVKSNSVILGDIAAATIQMEQGSTVCGKISITANDKKIDENLFTRKKKNA